MPSEDYEKSNQSEHDDEEIHQKVSRIMNMLDIILIYA